MFSRVLESYVGYLQVGEIREVSAPVAIFMALVQTGLFENLVCQEILRSCSSIPDTSYDAHIPFMDAVHCCLKLIVEIILHTNVGRGSWCLHYSYFKINQMALEARQRSRIELMCRLEATTTRCWPGTPCISVYFYGCSLFYHLVLGVSRKDYCLLVQCYWLYKLNWINGK